MVPLISTRNNTAAVGALEVKIGFVQVFDMTPVDFREVYHVLVKRSRRSLVSAPPVSPSLEHMRQFLRTSVQHIYLLSFIEHPDFCPVSAIHQRRPPQTEGIGNTPSARPGNGPAPTLANFDFADDGFSSPDESDIDEAEDGDDDIDPRLYIKAAADEPNLQLLSSISPPMPTFTSPSA